MASPDAKETTPQASEAAVSAKEQTAADRSRDELAKKYANLADQADTLDISDEPEVEEDTPMQDEGGERREIFPPALGGKAATPLDWRSLCYHCGNVRTTADHPNKMEDCKGACCQCNEMHEPGTCDLGDAYIIESKKAIHELHQAENAARKLAKQKARDEKKASKDAPKTDKGSAANKSSASSKGNGGKQQSNNGASSSKKTRSDGWGKSGKGYPKTNAANILAKAAVDAKRDADNKVTKLQNSNNKLLNENKKLKLQQQLAQSGMMGFSPLQQNLQGVQNLMGNGQFNMSGYGWPGFGQQQFNNMPGYALPGVGLMQNANLLGGLNNANPLLNLFQANQGLLGGQGFSAMIPSQGNQAQEGTAMKTSGDESKSHRKSSKDDDEVVEVNAQHIQGEYTQAPGWVLLEAAEDTRVWANLSDEGSTYLPPDWLPLVHRVTGVFLLYEKNKHLATPLTTKVWGWWKAVHGKYPDPPVGWEGPERAVDEKK